MHQGRQIRRYQVILGWDLHHKRPGYSTLNKNGRWANQKEKEWKSVHLTFRVEPCKTYYYSLIHLKKTMTLCIPCIAKHRDFLRWRGVLLAHAPARQRAKSPENPKPCTPAKEKTANPPVPKHVKLAWKMGSKNQGPLSSHCLSHFPSTLTIFIPFILKKIGPSVVT